MLNQPRQVPLSSLAVAEGAAAGWARLELAPRTIIATAAQSAAILRWTIFTIPPPGDIALAMPAFPERFHVAKTSSPCHRSRTPGPDVHRVNARRRSATGLAGREPDAPPADALAAPPVSSLRSGPKEPRHAHAACTVARR